MRLVSLVPSLTETLHDLGVGPSVLGVTKFCVRPETARETAAIVGGTKDPDIPAILSLRPDLVLADEDENKPEHVQELTQAGLHVHTTRIETVAHVARELRAIGQLVGRGHEAEKYAADLQEAAAQTHDAARLMPSVRCFVPVWKRPLMSMGGRTYMSDLLRIAGAQNVFQSASKKYFEADADEVRMHQPEAILLPTEPYRFRESDRGFFMERFGLPIDRIKVVDGEAFTWFGTHSIRGIEVIAQAVAELREKTVPPT